MAKLIPRGLAESFTNVFQAAAQRRQQQRQFEARQALEQQQMGLLEAFRTSQLAQQKELATAPKADIVSGPGGGLIAVTTQGGQVTGQKELVAGIPKQLEPTKYQYKTIDTGTEIIEKKYDPIAGEAFEMGRIKTETSPSAKADGSGGFEFTAGIRGKIADVISPAGVSITGDPIGPAETRAQQMNNYEEVKNALGGQGANWLNKLEKQKGNLLNPNELIEAAEKAEASGEISSATAAKLETLVPYYGRMYESLSKPVRTLTVE
jgi:hypothetical protein